MYRESIERTGLMLYFRLPRAAFISCKKTLFEHAISMQELFSQILDLLDKRDPCRIGWHRVVSRADLRCLI